MSHDKSFDISSQQALKEKALSLSDEDLMANMIGFDLGVVRQVTGYTGKVYHFDTQEMARLKQLTTKTKRYQRKLARISRGNDRQQGTNKRKRTKV